MGWCFGRFMELCIDHFGVFAVKTHQFMMRALFDDCTVDQNCDGIGIHDRAQSVGDNNGCPVFEDFLEGVLDGVFRFGIEARCRFVQYQDFRLFEDTPRGHPLLLSAGELDPTFADNGLVLVRNLR